MGSRPRDKDEIDRWNATDADFPPASVVDLFEASVRRFPGRPAIVDPDESWTYGRLGSAADRLALGLLAAGIRPGEPVGVRLDRSAKLAAAALGIFKAGAVYVPFSAHDPPARIGDCLRAIGGSKIIVADLDADASGPLAAAARIGIDSLLGEDSAASAKDVLPQVSLGLPAYVVFTSGSTGKPKGVLVEHGALSNQLQWIARDLPLEPGDRVAFRYNPGFDAALSEMLGTLVQGASLVTIPSGADRRADLFARMLVEQSISVIDIPPSFLAALLQLPAFARADRLRLVLCGGESLPDAVAERFFASTRAELVNCYGPSETTVTATFDRLAAGAPGPVTIGRPVANMRAYLLDDSLAPVPAGELGEICLAGAQVARGYVDATERQQRRFLPSPYRPGERLYRTGDRGRRLADGRILYCGRVDEQIKLRGYRIELGEVAAALAREPGIESCAAGLIGPPAAQRLAAWIVARPDCRPALEELQARLARRLPPQMIPTDVFAVSALPSTPDGKLDRRALDEALGERLRPLGGRVLPGTRFEIAIAALVEDLLGFAPNDVHSSFFDIGGDSLSAVALVTRIRHLLGVSLDVNDLFEAPSIAALAARAQRVGVAAAQPLPPLRQAPPAARRRVNPTQRDLLDREAAGGAGGELSCLAVRWTGPLCLPTLDRAFGQTVARHELLHSRFVRDADGWRSEPRPGDGASIEYAECSRPPPAELALEAVLPDHWLAPFPAGQGPLVRLGALELESEQFVILLAAHPAACDSMSIEIVLRDLSRFYFHRVSGCALPGALLAAPGDHGHWLEQVASLPQTGEQFDFLRRQVQSSLGPAPPPGPAGSGAGADAEGATARSITDAALIGAIEEQAQARGLDMEAVLAAAMVVATDPERAAEPSLLGIGSSARHGLPEIEGLVGCFANILPLAIPPAAARPDDETLLELCQSRLALARECATVPLAAVLRTCEPPRSIADTPEVLIHYRRVHPMAAGTVTLTPVPVSRTPRSRPLTVTFIHDSGGLDSAWRFRGDRHSPETMAKLPARFEEALRQIAERWGIRPNAAV